MSRAAGQLSRQPDQDRPEPGAEDSARDSSGAPCPEACQVTPAHRLDRSRGAHSASAPAIQPPAEVHAGDCHFTGRRRRAVSRDEARRLLAAGLRACAHDQPDTQLGILGQGLPQRSRCPQGETGWAP
ncbi:DUF6233 domain-containing protein [Streptomyces sp. NPDC000983]|uniref:DUF6233 domain-containing protein n=1 Tax=Streptomyces sp. NPDC000983 TaxID=3154373 RepID=UPI003334596C